MARQAAKAGPAEKPAGDHNKRLRTIAGALGLDPAVADKLTREDAREALAAADGLADRLKAGIAAAERIEAEALAADAAARIVRELRDNHPPAVLAALAAMLAAG
jgi:hypothetical protein